MMCQRWKIYLSSLQILYKTAFLHAKKDRRSVAYSFFFPSLSFLPESLVPFRTFPVGGITFYALSRVASSCGSVYLRDLFQGFFWNLLLRWRVNLALSHNCHPLYFFVIFRIIAKVIYVKLFLNFLKAVSAMEKLSLYFEFTLNLQKPFHGSFHPPDLPSYSASYKLQLAR
jgi:hypothetical protein